MNDLVAWYLDQYSGAEQTVKNMRSTLTDFQEWADDQDIALTDVKPHEVTAYLNHLEDRGYGDTSINRRATSLDNFYSFLVEKQDSPFYDFDFALVGNPLDEVDNKDRRSSKDTPKYVKESGDKVLALTKEQIEILIDNIGEPQTRNELIIRLMLQTGLRPHEVRNVKLDNLYQSNNEIRFYSEKVDDDRYSFYQPSLNTLLDEYLNIYRPTSSYASESPYLFVTNRSEKISQGGINYVVKNAAKRGGIQEVTHQDAKEDNWHRVTAHALRHTFAVHAYRNGMGIYEISQQMGHENVETTRTYLRTDRGDQKEKVNQFGPSLDRMS